MVNNNKINGKFNSSIGRENKIIGVVSAKGGVGKTTTAINIGATAVSLFNKSVLIIDTNLNTGSLCLNLGLMYHPVSMHSIIKNPVSIIHSVHKHKSGLHVIPSSLVKEKKKINPLTLKKRLRALSNYDLILLDSAPGVGEDAQISIKTADGLLLVVTPDLPTIGTALKTVEQAKKLKIPIYGIVLNRVKNVKYEVSSKYIETTLGLPILAVVPEDKSVHESVPARMPVVLHKPYSDASISFKKLSAFLLGKRLKKRNFLNILIEEILRFG